MKYSTLFAIALLGASTAMASTGNIVANGSFEVLPGALRFPSCIYLSVSNSPRP
jgi:hypothetical protein